MIERALIVGGGVGGMAAALALRRVGVEIALIDADPKWRVSGAGITLTGISLRALDDLGVLAEVRARGYVGAGLRARNASGEVEMEVAVPEHPQPIESTGGILRPELHAILSQRVRDSGTDVRLGVRVERIAQAADSVHAVFTDGREASYDLVVGADGIYSPLREMVFPNAAKPTFTGQGCWRVVARRPVDVDRSEMYFGGPVKIGLVPVSQDEMYMFLLEHVPDNPFYDDTERIPHLKKLMAPFGGHINALREDLNADGLVLAAELARNDDPASALDAFMRRRFERTRLVVESSVRIGDIQMAGGRQRQDTALPSEAMRQLRASY